MSTSTAEKIKIIRNIEISAKLKQCHGIQLFDFIIIIQALSQSKVDGQA